MILRLLAIFILLLTVAAPASAANWLADSPSDSGSSSSISTIPLVFAGTPSDNQGSLPMADIVGGAMQCPSASPIAADPIAPAQSSEGSTIIKLAGPPAALILIVQGLVFMGLIRGRRKWVLLVFAMIAVGRAGLQALPRLFTLESESAPARTSSASQFTQQEGQRLASEAHTASLDYVWMLRRAGSAPLLPRSTFEQTIAKTVVIPANGMATSTFAALSLPAHAPAVDRPLPVAFQPQEASPSLSRDLIPFSLFARSPPAVSA